MISLHKILSGFLFLILFSCQGQSQLNKLSVDNIFALDGEQAKYHITTDRMDSFFERINPNEIGLQMRQNPSKLKKSKEELIKQYKDYLKSDVVDFTPSDIEFVDLIFGDLYKSAELQQLSMPDSLLLIKVAGSHYGNSVYYTRENCIIIPENVLIEKDKTAFSGVMLHEIFHVFSRYNPAIQKELYKIIGFEAIENLSFEEALAERLIYNPDGLDMNWTISLEINGEPTLVSPIILSKVNPDFKKGLFPNFEFKLYALEESSPGSFIILSDQAGNSTLQQDLAMNSYFKQIGTNTGYIIHPDEILADHFMMIMRGDKVNLNNLPFTDKNLEIYNSVKAILTP